MTDCNTPPLLFASLGSKKIQADFKGGSLTSDAGALLLRQVDKKLGLLDAFDRCRPDPRHATYTTHAQINLPAQRIFGKLIYAAQVSTIRLKLLKIGAGVICSVRRIVLHLAGGYPLQ